MILENLARDIRKSNMGNNMHKIYNFNPKISLNMSVYGSIFLILVDMRQPGTSEIKITYYCISNVCQIEDRGLLQEINFINNILIHLQCILQVVNIC